MIVMVTWQSPDSTGGEDLGARVSFPAFHQGTVRVLRRSGSTCLGGRGDMLKVL